MEAVFLVKHGPAGEAFEMREAADPLPGPGEACIAVEAFGLNYADVQARKGIYKAAPPPPSILGYDVVGRIASCHSDVTQFKPGERVVALTRFGGYATKAIASAQAMVKIPDEMDPGVAVALSTQCCTAYYLAVEMANLQPRDKVLIYAAAGGVGTALVQIAKHRGCFVLGTTSTDTKIQYLESAGVDVPIQYREKVVLEQVREVAPSGLDVIFNPVGGKTVKDGFRLLAAGGRIFTYGVSAMGQASGILDKLKILWGFGFYHPIQFLTRSRGMVGVNMLELADQQPHKISRILHHVVAWYKEGILQPHVGCRFSAQRIAEAHEALESGLSMGKIVVTWSEP